jgi:hypothetical protein
MGLRLRLILVLIIPPVLVVGVYGFIRVRTGRAELLAETENTVQLLAKAIQASVERGLRDPRTSDLDGMLAEIVKDREQIDRIRVFDLGQRLLFASSQLPAPATVPVEVLRRVAESGRPEGVSMGRGKEHVFADVLPIRSPHGTVIATMEVAHLMAPIDAADRARPAARGPPPAVATAGGHPAPGARRVGPARARRAP